MDRESPDDGLFESEKKEENDCEYKDLMKFWQIVELYDFVPQI
jgi:hypothetical protein